MEKEKILILVVDDSATMRLLISNALVKTGFEVMQAENGEIALAVLKTTKPDAILLDVEMPGSNGFEVCKTIRQLLGYEHIPVMMVTALEDYESINQAFLAGATDFTTKPINTDLIGYRVRYMVRTSSYFEELLYAEKKVRALNDELLAKLVEIQENAKAVARFVPKDFLKVLNRQSIADIKLGDCVEKEMTILFLDIKSFSSLAERLSSVEIFNLVNSLMKCLDPVIVTHSGFIDKYIGDALMALFEEADHALSAALAMLEAINELNKKRILDHLDPIDVGIGINTGSVIVGTIGFESRMDCSVISDAVNIASRIESLTRQFNIELLISEQTQHQLKNKEKYKVRSLGSITIKGKRLPITIYEVFNHEDSTQGQLKKNSSQIFAKALNFYEKKDYSKAVPLFEEIIRNNPKDLPARYLLEQCFEK
jgi:adenylate cyclase